MPERISALEADLVALWRRLTTPTKFGKGNGFQSSGAPCFKTRPIILCQGQLMRSLIGLKVETISQKGDGFCGLNSNAADPDCRCHYQKPLEWCYGAVSSFLANPPGLGEV